MSGRKYAEDKPKDCRYCYFWNKRKKECDFREDGCFYLLAEPEKSKSPCEGCPYGKHQPCLGWCTKALLGQGGITR